MDNRFIMDKDITLVRAFFNRAIAALNQAETFQERAVLANEAAEHILVVHIMTVAGIETFFNCYVFPLSIGGAYESDFRDDLERRLPLEAKLYRWPEKLFGTIMTLDRGPCRKFVDGKERRNSLIHYHLDADGPFSIDLDQMTVSMAQDIIDGALAIIDQLLFLQGLPPAQAKKIRQIWTGQ